MANWIPSSSWSLSEQESKGVVILLHGLNNAPESMNSFIRVLNQAGFDALRVELAGHHSFGVNRYEVVLQDWFSDLEAAVREAKGHSPTKKIFIFGYSLGASLAIAFFDRFPDESIKGMFFLAPAIRLRPISHVLRFLTWARRWRIGLPSVAPRRYRAWTLTPLQQYHLLFYLVDSINTLVNRAYLNKIPCKLMIIPGDELISYRGLTAWIDLNCLQKWEIVSLSKDRSPVGFNHLCLNAETAGVKHWSEVTEEMLQFIEKLV